jgi:hypothetical protein
VASGFSYILCSGKISSSIAESTNGVVLRQRKLPPPYDKINHDLHASSNPNVHWSRLEYPHKEADQGASDSGDNGRSVAIKFCCEKKPGKMQKMCWPHAKICERATPPATLKV